MNNIQFYRIAAKIILQCHSDTLYHLLVASQDFLQRVDAHVFTVAGLTIVHLGVSVSSPTSHCCTTEEHPQSGGSLGIKAT